MTVKVQASELRVPMTILSEVDPSEDDWAHEADQWQEVGRCMAKLKALTGLEAIVGDGIDNIQRYECVIRYRMDITPDHVLRDDRTGQLYQIESVVNDDQRSQWTVMRVVFNHAQV